ncbi:MAG: CBS domain-containing protein [Nitrososphaeraceae archaeon]|nr:CBS domain-containing protein [Nitrososphaeraceae archaeon]MBV9667782.1 CBS domain-containing protein [Nitrososphaeraceae archaeon]
MSNKSKSLENTRIEEIMSKKRMVTLNADSTAFDAAKKMSENLVSSIILTDSSKLVGIVTERDLIRQVCANDLLSSKTPLTSIMSSPLITIDKDLVVQEAARTMIKNKVRHLVIENKRTRHVVGIISSTDLIKFLIDRLELDSDSSSFLSDLYWLEEPTEELDI